MANIKNFQIELEIKQRAQRDPILTYIFVMAAKKLNFYFEKRVKIFVKNTKVRFFLSNVGVQYRKSVNSLLSFNHTRLS